MEQWPNFFIVGAPRCGTTSLHRYLSKIPGIFMSPFKEPNYFNPNVKKEFFIFKPIRDKKKYLKLFERVTSEIAIGEASPTYLMDPSTPSLISKVIPNAKIIAILRDPVDRIFSEFLFLLGTASVKSSFSDTIRQGVKGKNYSSKRLLDSGLYYEQVKRYFETFGEKQVKIIIFEEFFQDAKKNLTDVLDFLGIKQEVLDFEDEIHNPFIVPKGKFPKYIMGNKMLRKFGKNILPKSTIRSLRDTLTEKAEKPNILDQDRKFLCDFYRKDVEKLKQLLNHPLPWKNFFGDSKR